MFYAYYRSKMRNASAFAKFAIFNEALLECGKGMQIAEVAETYGIPYSTLYKK